MEVSVERQCWFAVHRIEGSGGELLRRRGVDVEEGGEFSISIVGVLSQEDVGNW
jgi:hypothetical protein